MLSEATYKYWYSVELLQASNRFRTVHRTDDLHSHQPACCTGSWSLAIIVQSGYDLRPPVTYGATVPARIVLRGYATHACHQTFPKSEGAVPVSWSFATSKFIWIRLETSWTRSIAVRKTQGLLVKEHRRLQWHVCKYATSFSASNIPALESDCSL